MAKSISSLVLNAALSYIQANATRMTVCSEQPTTVAMAYSTEKLGVNHCERREFYGKCRFGFRKEMRCFGIQFACCQRYRVSPACGSC